MRLAPLLAALSLALCACTYAEEKPDIHVQVDNVPAGANHLEVQLTDSSGAQKDYAPAIGPGAQTSVALAFNAPAAPGTFTVNVTARDRDQNSLATGSVQGSVPTAATLQMTLATTGGQVGQFGSPCNTLGGATAACFAGLDCKQYVPNNPSSGICTQSCTTPADCLPGSVSPAAVCEAFPGTTAKYCQWYCDAGPAGCPSGLQCHTGSPHSYCEGN